MFLSGVLFAVHILCAIGGVFIVLFEEKSRGWRLIGLVLVLVNLSFALSNFTNNYN